MNTLNPNKYIRKAYIEAIENQTALKVWHRKIPKTVNPIPTAYILLDSQTKNETAKAKTDYFEWLCTLDVHIFNVNDKGYSNQAFVDDIEGIVNRIIRVDGVVIENFVNKNTNILESMELPIETETKSIDRTVIKFEHWLYGR